MVSATKFVVAGVIVALFGGFLLTGVLKQQQGEETAPVVGASASAEVEAEPTVEATTISDPTVRTDILPGVELVTEAVEPGVIRIVSDGERELSIPVVVLGGGFPWLYQSHSGIVVAPDESVWIFGPEEFFRLGDQASHEGRGGVVDADGTVWAGTDRGLETFDDGEWDLKARNVGDFELHPDGSLFMIRDMAEDHRALIGPVSKDDWKDKREVRSRSGMEVGDEFVIDPSSGENGVYSGVLEPSDEGDLVGWELTEDGGRKVGPLYDVEKVHSFAYGPDGTSWRLVRFDRLAVVEGSPRPTSTSFLTRVLPGDDMSGVSFEAPEIEKPGVPSFGRLVVAADQSLWLPSYEGLAHFDGQTWTWYLRGHVIDDIDFAADGSVWVQAADVDPLYHPELGTLPIDEQGATVSTYVIRPEAGSSDG